MLIKKKQKIDMENNNFLCFTLNPKKSRIWAFLLVFLILGICLFPIWPYFVKLCIFYISLYLLIFIIALSIVRFIIFYFFRLFGYEFWILPELFEVF